MFTGIPYRGQLRPHPFGDRALLLAQGIGVDRRRLDRGVPHPFRQHVERHCRADRRDPVAVPQALGRCLRPLDVGGRHDRLYVPPGRRSAPGPERPALLPPTGFPDAVDEHQRVDEAWRDRNGPVDASAALLEGFEDHSLAVEVDAGHGQRQRLGDPAAGEVQDLAEGANLPLGLLGREEEDTALGGGQIQPIASKIDQVGH